MANIQFSIVQFLPKWRDAAGNLQLLEELLQENLKQQDESCRLVVLPEMFASGFSMQPEQFAEAPQGEISQALSRLAQEYQAAFIAGVAQKQESPECYLNRALYFDASGQEQAFYSKQRLFAYAGEDKIYQRGKESKVFQIQYGSHSISAAAFVCYDLRFPELFRQIAKQVDMIFVIANWPSSRQMHWKTLLKARAIENQCFVVGVNRLGEDANGLHYSGDSLIFNANGDCVLDCQQSLWNDFSLPIEKLLQDVNNQRTRFPFLMDLIEDS